MFMYLWDLVKEDDQIGNRSIDRNSNMEMRIVRKRFYICEKPDFVANHA